ncbi:MAG: hypothetical protein ACYCXA_11440 [Actinomycetes bacterium]
MGGDQIAEQLAALVSFQVEAGGLHGHAEHGRGGGDGHLVLEHLEESGQLLIGIVRVDGGLVDQLGERLRHDKQAMTRARCDHGSRKIR